MYHAHRLAGPLTAIALALPGAAVAQDSLVVVELYTSQGCSSCPPADALLEEMAKNVEILPLAFHVDYWDYLGWQDAFASPAHTLRQKAYAHAAGERMIYTPQAIVDGTARMVGSDSHALMSAVMQAMNKDRRAKVSVSRDGATLTVTGTASESLPAPVQVLLVRYTPEASVEILHGENAGQTIRYVNTVTSVTQIGEWTGAQALSLTAPISGAEAAAILVQAPDMGAVLAAALVP